ncbi:unnamed protein product [Acanthoscelides obtectus]|uniref:Uncharacterized protein n=1 Tax=Acanthoscelides obtectus TaxID=200917 RepID=A0A9P0LSN2_ACAOB|nr:unnamed protein product [Acanthoscelides obtectus]CAK1654811.1 hypothetical protein AOBTE_LOCUS18863 [Acanthoscelides obtectus]
MSEYIKAPNKRKGNIGLLSALKKVHGCPSYVRRTREAAALVIHRPSSVAVGFLVCRDTPYTSQAAATESKRLCQNQLNTPIKVRDVVLA